MGKSGRFLRETPKNAGGKGKKVALILIIVLVVLLAIAAVAGVVIYNSALDKINYAEVVDKDVSMTPEIENLMNLGGSEPTEATEDDATEAATEETIEETVYSDTDILNVLVVGQSARAGEESRLADTMILVTFNKGTKHLTLTSFLRDTYVDLPDYKGHSCGWNRLNTAYALGYLWGDTGGAMEMTNMCIKDNFGIEVDYNVEINFEAFTKIVDVLGGIRVELTQAEADYLNGHGKTWQEVTPGRNYLYGDAALSYARMRKAEGDSDSDIKRTARQRAVILAVLEKLVFMDVSTIMDMINEVMPMITTNMTKNEITDTLTEVLPMLIDITGDMGTCPVSNDVLPDSYWGATKDTPDGPASILEFDRGKNTEYMQAITEGITK